MTNIFHVRFDTALTQEDVDELSYGPALFNISQFFDGYTINGKSMCVYYESFAKSG